MRSLSRAVLVGFMLALASSVVGQGAAMALSPLARGSNGGQAQAASTSPVTLSVAAGYGNEYRDSDWTPIRITLTNRGDADIAGTVQTAEANQTTIFASSQPFRGQYGTDVTLPAGSTKQVTLYVPGVGVQGQVNVVFRRGDRTLASGTSTPIGIDTSVLLVGVMASDRADSDWLVRATRQGITTHVVRLTASTLDPLADALAAFDVIVLTDANVSRLDAAQFGALRRYVNGGGALVVIGGPKWQGTLKPLPAGLVPGRIAGTQTLPDLHGLNPLARVQGSRFQVQTNRGSASGSVDSQSAVVSVLRGTSGTVVAEQAGVPLVVRKMVGRGAIEYLAFDPAFSPVAGWRGASDLLQHLITMAAPLAASRTWGLQGLRASFRRAFTSTAVTNELGNMPPTRQPLFSLLALLIVAYVFVLGTAGFVVFRRFRRRSVALVAIPVLAVLCVGTAYGMTERLKGESVVLNSIGIISLDSTGSSHPATFYMGVTSPMGGTYHLSYNAPALPAPIVRLYGFRWRGGPALNSGPSPVSLQVQEGTRTSLTLKSMKSWAMRNVSLTTSVHIPGGVRSDLHVDAHGDVTGVIHNGTNLNLLDPVIVAGQSVVHLPSIAAGATTHARIRPDNDVETGDSSRVWSSLYGNSGLDNGDGFFGGFHDCCDGVSLPPERTLKSHIGNAAAVLTQSQTLSSFGEVVLVGWSDKPLGTFTVDGNAPQRRDLNLIVVPLSVRFPKAGPFRVRPGTLGAHLVDVTPLPPKSNCCTGFPDDPQISVGAGGAVTFQFDIPSAKRVHFNRLEIDVNDGTANGSTPSAFDWSKQRWVRVNLPAGSGTLRDPSRYISPDGHILLKFLATKDSGDISIDDQYGDLALSGSGYVS